MKTAWFLAIWISVMGGVARSEAIGGWVLACPGGGSCAMRVRFLDKAGVTGDLEVRADGESLVPVIALRGVAAVAASLAGTTVASLQFDRGLRAVLDCVATGDGYVCAPKDARDLAAALPRARLVTVRVTVAVAGSKPLPVRDASLQLSGTAEALARLRVLGPTPLPGPLAALQSPSGLMWMLQWLASFR